MASLAILSEIPALRRDLRELFKSIKKSQDWKCLRADFKNNPDPFGDPVSAYIDVTVGCTFDFDNSTISWNYQTGDNSYTGGAYGHPEWFITSLTGRSNCKDLANEMINEIHGRIAEIISLEKHNV